MVKNEEIFKPKKSQIENVKNNVKNEMKNNVKIRSFIDNIPPSFENWLPMVIKIYEMQETVESIMNLHVSNDHIHEKKHLQNELQELRPGLEMLQGKYTLDLIFLLNGMQFQYFNQIKENLPYINPGTLSKRLKELEKFQIIERKVHTGTPVRVSYTITQLGKGIFQLLLPVVVFIRFADLFHVK